MLAASNSKVTPPYRVSGHESFPCRYTWLPKAVRGLEGNPQLFSDENRAMVELGLGKNMVRSVRFWAQAAGITAPLSRGNGYKPTAIGAALLGAAGWDPYLEDIRTLWLIHWRLSTSVENPLLAWDFLLNRWQAPELVPSTIIEALKKELIKRNVQLSETTLEQHFETFLHTYVPTRGRKGEVMEDNLDCPLVELDFIFRKGERPGDEAGGRGESIYAFRRESKPEINPGLFAYCLNDFWRVRHPDEKTLPFHAVAYGHGSPGQIFKLEEQDIRERLEGLADQTSNAFAFSPSADLQQVHLNKQIPDMDLLCRIYQGEATA